MPLSERRWRFRLGILLRGRSYRDYYERMERMASADPIAMSSEHLVDLLSFASRHNEYYAPLLAQGRSLDRLPILTKDTIRRRFEAIRSKREFPGTFRTSSGGSTGRPITLVQDARFASWVNATQGYYFREFLNVGMNEVKNLWLWGSERESLRMRNRRMRSAAARFLKNQMFLNTFDVDQRRWLDYMERIRRFRPHYVAGYAGSLYQMALMARKHNVRLYRPEFLYSSAEMMRDFMREEIEEQFGAKVYDFYGSREVGAMAGECRAGNMHVFVMNNLMEVLDGDGRPVAGGSEGNLVVTCLHNYSLPMIRYAIGDTGALSSESCPCGSALPVLKKLTGRITDHFILKDGTLVHGEFVTHLFYLREWVEQFQVDQVEYDRVRIRVVRNGESDENDVREIEHAIQFVMGSDCKLEWEYVDSIEKSPQGKHLFTRCLVRNGAGGVI